MDSSTRTGSRAAGITGACLLMLMAGCGYDGAGPYGGGAGGGGVGGVTSGHTLTIAMQGAAFGPQLDTVTVGSTVTWSNQDGIEHTTTSDGGLWESGVMAGGQNFQHEYTQTGEYPYHCRFHGAVGGVGMAGTIVVVP